MNLIIKASVKMTGLQPVLKKNKNNIDKNLIKALVI